MKHTLLIKDWLGSFLSLFFPHCCIVCGRPLAKGEECLCTMCNINLPRTDYHLRKDNPVEKQFWGKIPLERATSFFFYRKEVTSGKFSTNSNTADKKASGQSWGVIWQPNCWHPVSLMGLTSYFPCRCTKRNSRFVVIIKANG